MAMPQDRRDTTQTSKLEHGNKHASLFAAGHRRRIRQVTEQHRWQDSGASRWINRRHEANRLGGSCGRQVPGRGRGGGAAAAPTSAVPVPGKLVPRRQEDASASTALGARHEKVVGICRPNYGRTPPL